MPKYQIYHEFNGCSVLRADNLTISAAQAQALQLAQWYNETVTVYKGLSFSYAPNQAFVIKESQWIPKS